MEPAVCIPHDEAEILRHTTQPTVKQLISVRHQASILDLASLITQEIPLPELHEHISMTLQHQPSQVFFRQVVEQSSPPDPSLSSEADLRIPEPA